MNIYNITNPTEVENQKNKILAWCDDKGINGVKLGPDLLINVEGSVNLTDKGLTELPYKFGYVSEHFSVSHNYLSTLKNCPDRVEKYFICSNNYLTNLKGSPRYVGANMSCNHNELENLEGAPDYIGTIFECDNNPALDNLSGLSKKIDGVISCNGRILPWVLEHPEIFKTSMATRIIFYQSPATQLSFMYDQMKNLSLYWEDLEKMILMIKLNQNLNEDNNATNNVIKNKHYKI